MSESSEIKCTPALVTLVSEANPPGVEAKDVKLKLSEPCQHIDLRTKSVDAKFIIFCLVSILLA